jgi:hypothetical protein
MSVFHLFAGLRSCAWCRISPHPANDPYDRYGRRYPQAVELSENDQAELDQLTAAPDVLELAGAIVTLSHQGGLRIERGYVHPDKEMTIGQQAPNASDISCSSENSPASSVLNRKGRRLAALLR